MITDSTGHRVADPSASAAADPPDERQDDFDEESEPRCRTCGGDGFVESVAAESGRHGWDDEGPGPCPNCRGSGPLKNCTTF